MASHRHSLSAPNPIIRVPATAPNSPANIKTAAYTRPNRYVIPITPQRNQQRQTQSAYQPRRRGGPSTPLTTSTTSASTSPSTSSPYTPLSARSHNTSFSSNVTTPGSAYSTKRLDLGSSEVRKGDESGKESLADIAENWRSRANENGIKVSGRNSEGDGDADDEASERANSSKGNPPDPTDPKFTKPKQKQTPTPQSQSDNPLGPGYVPEETLPPPTARRPRTYTQPQPPAHSQSFNGFGREGESEVVPMFFTPGKPSSRRQSEPQGYREGENSFDLELSRACSLDVSQDQEQGGYTADQSFSFSTSSLESSPRVLRTPARRTKFSFATDPRARSLMYSLTRDEKYSENQNQNYDSSNQNLSTPPPKPSSHSFLASRGTLSEPPRPPGMRRNRGGYNIDMNSSFGMGGRELFDIDEDFGVGVGGGGGYPYEFGGHEFGSPTRPGLGRSQGLGLNDPFFPLPLPLPNVERGSDTYPYSQSQSLSSPYTLKTQPSSKPTAESPVLYPLPDACSVCGRTSTSNAGCPKAVLIPCAHPLCSACLTSALNIVGEKDMQCSVCKCGVEDFRLVDGWGGVGAAHVEKESGQKARGEKGMLEFFEDVRARSSPPPVKAMGVVVGGAEEVVENVVLRIDNVPWDITPPLIRSFFSHPPSLTAIHVLLDPKGKTLSHAFVEFSDPEAAKAALRGAQKNAVLGKGRRARGVTVTRSSQEELMGCLFPAWKGSWVGSKPSLAPHNAVSLNPHPNTSNPALLTTLQTGLLPSSALSALHHLIRKPDAHFLKVPVLPFWVLVSLLRKLPVDGDSRVFWGRDVRDGLFGVVVGALGVLGGRVAEAGGGGDEELLGVVFEASMSCEAFTSEQKSKLTSIVDNTPYSYGLSSESPPGSPLLHLQTSKTHCHPHHPAHAQAQGEQVQIRRNSNAHGSGNGNAYGYTEPFDALAREFGVEAQLVQALAQRLAVF